MGLWAETVQQDVRGYSANYRWPDRALPCRRHSAISTIIAGKTIRPLSRTEVHCRRDKPGAVGHSRFLSIQR